MTGRSRKACALALTTLLAVLGTAAAVRAEDDGRDVAWMSGDAIRGTFGGQPLAGTYPTGKPWTENILADGTTDYREGGKHWKGKWWISDRAFCFAYPPMAAGGCFRVVRVSPNCFELYDFSGDLGKADVPPSLRGAWNGRMWLTAQPATCKEQPLS